MSKSQDDADWSQEFTIYLNFSFQSSVTGDNTGSLFFASIRPGCPQRFAATGKLRLITTGTVMRLASGVQHSTQRQGRAERLAWSAPTLVTSPPTRACRALSEHCVGAAATLGLGEGAPPPAGPSRIIVSADKGSVAGS